MKILTDNDFLLLDRLNELEQNMRALELKCRACNNSNDPVCSEALEAHKEWQRFLLNDCGHIIQQK